MKFNHDWLFRHGCRKLAQDYEPYGTTPRERDGMWGADCSCGCKWAWWLGPDTCPVGDWCICLHKRSHRCGMLTFEHQGCWEFESGPEPRMREDTPKEMERFKRQVDRRAAKREKALPTRAELAGSDRDFTGDMTTAEYIDRIRGHEDV